MRLRPCLFGGGKARFAPGLLHWIKQSVGAPLQSDLFKRPPSAGALVDGLDKIHHAIAEAGECFS
ncbi:hypothetical protein MJC1_02440 [Methylocystis sp. MJC1]|jgi:hypothetical protein|nr:hypothetical protein MJC1_02440 [Methylocystis sp. MJC1]